MRHFAASQTSVRVGLSDLPRSALKAHERVVIHLGGYRAGKRQASPYDWITD